MGTGVLLVSLDFEMFWGMQDATTTERYGENILGGIAAIPQLLEIFQAYHIHASWATVGFLFAENASEAKKFFPPESQLPTYDNSALSTYRCFTGSDMAEEDAAFFFAPSIVKKIADTPGQEIASHTFSHYYCKEPGQTFEQFRADLKAAVDIANANGQRLTSIVFPRNQSDESYVKVLGEYGFKAYRAEENDWIHNKIKNKRLKKGLRLLDVYFPLTGLGGYVPEWDHDVLKLTGSRMYKPYFKPLFFLERLKLHRIKRQMLHAAKHGLVFHLWWHPHNIGVKTQFHLRQLSEIFEYFKYLEKKYGMKSMNMKEVSDLYSQKGAKTIDHRGHK